MGHASVHPDIRELSHRYTPCTLSPSDVKAQRTALGLTQVALAAELGVSELSVWKWEHGRCSAPSLLTLALAYLNRRRVQRRSIQKRRKRDRLLAESLRLRPPVKHLFY